MASRFAMRLIVLTAIIFLCGGWIHGSSSTRVSILDGFDVGTPFQNLCKEVDGSNAEVALLATGNLTADGYPNGAIPTSEEYGPCPIPASFQAGTFVEAWSGTQVWEQIAQYRHIISVAGTEGYDFQL